MDVSTWLRGLGLERYIQAFEDNDVDALTLAQLTEADLIEIGVKSVGHRRRLIDAIAALDETGSSRGAARAGASPAPSALPPASGDAEQRQLTVLYCAMGDPSTQSSHLHAEEMREVIQSFHQTCTRVVADYDGYVANFFGDCVLAYFGWPRAHEDDVERAVRAGLVLARLIHRVAGTTLFSRVGIGTGPVVVGELMHGTSPLERSAVGLTPNLAARILGLAGPGQVVIDELTRRLLAPSFTLQLLGRHTLKGIAEPVAAYAVGGERPADSRFDAHKGRDLPPMVGREQELALLLERWSQAQGGEGQTVLMVGEAGIGKSRLARALLDACAEEPHWRILWQCSPYHSGSALWPVIQRLGRAAGLGTTPGLGAQDSTEDALDKLEAMTGQNEEAAALYATLLGLDGSQRYGPLTMTPQMLRERTLELLAEQLLEMAEQRPVLLVAEDTQWIDPTTLELIGRSLERIDGARVLIVITSRPDGQPKLGAHPSVTHLSLNRLGRASVEAMMARMGATGLPAQTRAAIVAQSDGVPLFIEELTKAVLETGEATIPASLHGSLMARLDRLPEVKEVAQIAACIGREFDEALVRSVAEQPPQAVAAALDKLTEVELVFRRGDRANPRYAFKHTLVQEVARESLLRGRRQRIHARILEVLETERPQTAPETLAHHAQEARATGKAIGYWSQAGNAALAKSAYVEAIGYLGNAVALIQAAADGVDRRALELELQLQLGQAHTATRGFGAEATLKAFARAEELLDPPAQKSWQGLRVYYGLWAWHVARADFRGALELATRALPPAQAQGSPAALLNAYRMVASSRTYLGDFDEARANFERVMALADSVEGSELIKQFGVDPIAHALCLYGLALCIQGHPQQSMQLQARARVIAATLPKMNARAMIHMFCAMGCACRRDVAAVEIEARAIAALAPRYRLSMYGQFAEVLLCWAGSGAEAPGEESARTYEQALNSLSAAGQNMWLPFFTANLATVFAACGRPDEALVTIGRAIERCEQTAETWFEAELWRVRGELLLRDAQREPAEAVGCFERALASSRARGARLWELRTAVSLARLRAKQGQRAQARELLAPVYGGFTEGFDTADLVEAHQLLAELGEQALRAD